MIYGRHPNLCRAERIEGGWKERAGCAFGPGTRSVLDGPALWYLIVAVHSDSNGQWAGEGMKIRFVITDPDGSQVAAGNRPTDTSDVGSLANAGHVVRLLRASNTILQIGQKLTVRIEDDQPQ